MHTKAQFFKKKFAQVKWCPLKKEEKKQSQPKKNCIFPSRGNESFGQP